MESLFYFGMFVFMFFPFDQVCEGTTVEITQDLKPALNDFLTNYIDSDIFKIKLENEGFIYKSRDFYINLIKIFLENKESIYISGNKDYFDSIVKKIISDFDYFVYNQQIGRIWWSQMFFLICLKVHFSFFHFFDVDSSRTQLQVKTDDPLDIYQIFISVLYMLLWFIFFQIRRIIQ